MKKSKQIALAGMLTALSVSLMFLSSIIWIFTYIAPIFCGLIMIILTESAGKSTAFITFLAVSILSLFLLSEKECGLTYAFFFGYYPIIVEKIEKIKPKPVLVLVKLLIFNVSAVLSQLVLIYVFGVPFDNIFGKAGIALLLVLANLIFFFYDRILKVYTLLYRKKYKKRVDRMLK